MHHLEMALHQGGVGGPAKSPLEMPQEMHHPGGMGHLHPLEEVKEMLHLHLGVALGGRLFLLDHQRERYSHCVSLYDSLCTIYNRNCPHANIQIAPSRPDVIPSSW